MGGAAPLMTEFRYRAAAGGCDAQETCSGGSDACPVDGFVANGTVCRAAAGVCDAQETCTGSSAA